jgi:aminopeptidase N
VGAVDPNLGAPMTITLTPGLRRIVIEYETGPDATALQWLSPAQTASGKPYLFTQGESIYTRTWIPTQDSPGIRQTYDARISVPMGLSAVMSAERLTPAGVPFDGQTIVNGPPYHTFHFRMTHPIPCYLFALAVGELEFRSTGPRTGVWSEPSVVDAAAAEFVDMDKMLRTAEALYGPYRWGRYDVLVLPPSFPFGGMENPTLTFATPTILAGDRSLVNVITHELAHSWSGNLVTNGVWADSWLNEGFTTYIEGRISEALYGKEQVAMADSLAWAQIQTALRTLPPDATRLHQLANVGPEDSSSAINYSKGALFLRTIEGVIGRQAIDAYLRSYFDRHAFQPMTTEGFLADFRAHVVRGNAALETRLQLNAWAYDPGLPSNAVEPHAAAFDRVAEQVTAFNAGGAASALPWANWGTYERQRFLQTLPRPTPAARLDELDHTLHLSALGNDEVLFDWLILCIRSNYETASPAIETFVTRQGRAKYVVPVYRALMRQPAWGPLLAHSIYARARPGYHPLVSGLLDPLMGAPT